MSTQKCFWIKRIFFSQWNFVTILVLSVVFVVHNPLHGLRMYVISIAVYMFSPLAHRFHALTDLFQTIQKFIKTFNFLQITHWWVTPLETKVILMRTFPNSIWVNLWNIAGRLVVRLRVIVAGNLRMKISTFTTNVSNVANLCSATCVDDPIVRYIMWSVTWKLVRWNCPVRDCYK